MAIHLGDEGMNLSPGEARLVARRLVAIRALNVDAWLEWEHLPELGEYAFGRLVDEVRAVGARLLNETHEMERIHGIDAADLISRAS